MANKMCYKTIPSLILIVLIIPSKTVTVNPALCPTNKIAPHRRIGNWDYQARTLGEFYNLLAPGSSNSNYVPNLLEEPQKDELEDCGEIEDYDENDLSSLTPHYLRRNGNDRYGKLFFGLFDSQSQQQRPPPGSSSSQGYPQNPQQYPSRPQFPLRPQFPTGSQYPQGPQAQYQQGAQAQYQQGPQAQHPQSPQRPFRPQQTRPPYSSGGYFGNNNYRPQVQHHPSDDFKPVNEGIPEPHTTYRPHLVGGPVGHVVGVTPVAVRPRPTRRPDPQDYERYQQAQNSGRPMPRRLNNDGIIGSFIDLLFK